MSYNKSITDVLQKYMCGGVYSDSIHRRITECRIDDINLYFTIIGLNTTKDLPLCEYDGNRFVTDVCMGDKVQFIYNSETNYKIRFFDHHSMNIFINNSNEYVFKPIPCIGVLKHLLMFGIDKANKRCFIIDVNCNNYYVKHFEDMLQIIVCNYNNEYNDNYKLCIIPYITKPINRELDNNYNGYCIILSFMLIQYVILSKIDIYEGIQHFSSLTNKQLQILIKKYSLYYYVCIY